MASSVEAIAERLRQVLDQVNAAERAVTRGLDLIGQTAGTFAHVMQGSSATESNEVAERLTSAQRALTDAQTTLAAVTGHLVWYLGVLGFGPISNAPPTATRATSVARPLDRPGRRRPPDRERAGRRFGRRMPPSWTLSWTGCFATPPSAPFPP